MSETPSEALTEFLKDYVGDHLRSVMYYDEAGADIVYVRDDVAEQYTDEDVEEVVHDVRLEAVEKPHQESLYAHGSMNVTVRCFEDAVEMHFPHDEKSGTAVALDGEVFAIHNTFIGQCLDAMQ
jgi:SpoVK/Ycf46/Vps4 family AAA+-type ATPase